MDNILKALCFLTRSIWKKIAGRLARISSEAPAGMDDPHRLPGLTRKQNCWLHLKNVFQHTV